MDQNQVTKGTRNTVDQDLTNALSSIPNQQCPQLLCPFVKEESIRENSFDTYVLYY